MRDGRRIAPWFALACALALVAPLAACGDAKKTASASATAVAAAGTCEHGVERDLCPKCNPELEAIYKDASNWCPEHGMPESFCPICHPQLGGKPDTAAAPAKKPETGPKAPSDGLKVTLKSRQAHDAADLRSVPVVKAPAKTAVHFPARVVHDATRTAELTASAGGVVRSVAVDLGATVKSGDLLATVDSGSVGAQRSELAAASRRLETARKNLARVKELETTGIVARKEVLEAELRVDEALADVSGFSAELGAAGAGSGAGGSYKIVSPLDGVVTRRDAVIGKRVSEETVLFQVVDTRQLIAEIEVPEREASKLAKGAEVVITFDGLPSDTFAGKIEAIVPAVDVHTRTLIARVALANPNGVLLANMFGDAAILGASPPDGVTIPRAALQTTGKQGYVFVRTGELAFEVRHVEVASKDDARVLVASGLRPGEEVVTTGAFLLKTETLKDSIGAGCCAAD